MINVMLVDDHPIVRKGLEGLFETVDDIEVVASAANGYEAVTLAADHQPDVVLMDLSMPELDGVEATRRIVASGVDSRVVVLTSYGDERRILDALNAGAHGYLLKHVDPDELINAVRVAKAGDSPLDPRAGRVLLEARRAGRGTGIGAALTDREVEVLRLVGRGMANKQVARQLGISERTVNAHLTSIFHRLDVTDRVQAALWAQQHLSC
jgi:DNA-binding NarL/FixJ family response regulator